MPWRILHTILHSLLAPLRALLLHPSIRYSDWYYQFEGIWRYYPREEMLKTALRYIKLSQIQGDYLEFGIFRGETLAAAFHLAKRNGLEAMRLRGFDSFEGLPLPKGVDAKGEYQFQGGDYRCSEEDVRARLKNSGVDISTVDLYAGWFDATLANENRNQIGVQRAALVWIDCDLYESTVPVLNFITPYLQDGAILVFDDWYCFRARRDMGEQKAFSEWLAKNPQLSAQQYHRFGWHVNSFIISIK